MGGKSQRGILKRVVYARPNEHVDMGAKAEVVPTARGAARLRSSAAPHPPRGPSQIKPYRLLSLSAAATPPPDFEIYPALGGRSVTLMPVGAAVHRCRGRIWALREIDTACHLGSSHDPPSLLASLRNYGRIPFVHRLF